VLPESLRGFVLETLELSHLKLELSHLKPNAFVVLGASNVARGLPRFAAAIDARNRPSDLFVAAGHGRSYGANSRVWIRRLPSILHSGLWRALDREGFAENVPATRRLHGLVTDVGNDLLYGFSVEQVAAWVREGVARLARRQAAIAITRLPLAAIARVGAIRYRAMRTFYVPTCPLSLAELKAATIRLDAALVTIAHDFKAATIEQPDEWYGLDAMHVRRWHLDGFWQQAFDAWHLEKKATRPRTSLGRWATIGSQAAEVRSLSDRMLFTPQPVVEESAGVSIWMY